ncbi:MAG: hypothetical protein U0Q16_36100 [Bryobacteraceae bacterium]
MSPKVEEWRWTARTFSAEFDDATAHTALRFDFYVPPVAMEHGPIAVSVNINGSPAASIRCDLEGMHHLRAPLPPGAGSIRADFAVDRALSLPGEKRELAVIVARLELQ